MIEEIKSEVEKICGGEPAKPRLLENPVAVVKWVDGTVLDTVPGGSQTAVRARVTPGGDGEIISTDRNDRVATTKPGSMARLCV